MTKSFKITLDTGVFTAEPEPCPHLVQMYDDRAQTVECKACKKLLSNYEAYKRVLRMLDEIHWQREAISMAEDRERNKQLRNQLTCRHSVAKKHGEVACYKCGFLMSGKYIAGEKMFDHMGREILSKTITRLAIAKEL